jgi:hypothetical protein
MIRFQFLSLCFASFFFSTLQAQNFYHRDTIQVIEIFFSFTNWDAQLDANEATESYIYADSVRINGISFDSCGIRYKGNSSYSPNNQKNPLRIELNTIKVNQDYHGIKDIKLSNCYKDPSMIREILSYQILEQYNQLLTKLGTMLEVEKWLNNTGRKLNVDYESLVENIEHKNTKKTFVPVTTVRPSGRTRTMPQAVQSVEPILFFNVSEPFRHLEPNSSNCLR